MRLLRNNLNQENLINYQRKKAQARRELRIVNEMHGGVTAITDKEKENILGKMSASVHSGYHLDDIHRQNKEKILNENRGVLKKKIMWKMLWIKWYQKYCYWRRSI